MGVNSRFALFFVTVFFLIFCLFAVGAPLQTVSGQDRIKVRAWAHSDYGRIVFDWPVNIEYATQRENNLLIVTFNRALNADLSTLRQELPAYVKTARLTPDQQQVVLTLTRDFAVETSVYERAVIIDLFEKRQQERLKTVQSPKPPQPDSLPRLTPQKRPENRSENRQPLRPQTKPPLVKAPSGPPPSGPPPSGPPPLVPPPLVTVRTGEHAGFSRVVFDWTQDVSYQITNDSGKLRLLFNRPARFDLDSINRRPPIGLNTITPQTTSETAEVILDMVLESRMRHFRNGTKVVIDILYPKTATVAARKPAPSPTKTTVSPPKTVPPAKTPLLAQSVLAPLSKPLPPQKPGKGKVKGINNDESFALHFSLPPQTLLVMYQRSGFTWVGFNRLLDLDLDSVDKAENPFLKEIIQFPNPDLTLLRLDTPPSISPQVLLKNSDWILDLARQPFAPWEGITPRLQSDALNQKTSLFLPEKGKKTLITTLDPLIGDTLILVPTNSVGRGIQGTHTYAQFSLPQTAQGIAIFPYDDSLQVKTRPDGVLIEPSDVLYISGYVETDSSIPVTGRPLITPDQWRKGPHPSFQVSKQIFYDRILNALPGNSNAERLQLAQYYFGQGLYQEASGLLDYMATLDPLLLNDPYYLLLHGATHILDQDPEGASTYLNTHHFTNRPEALLWQALLDSENNDWQEAFDKFTRGRPLMETYDTNLKRYFSLKAAEASLKNNKPEIAKTYLEDSLAQPPTSEDYDEALYLFTLATLAEGDRFNAYNLFEQLARSANRKISTQAQQILIDEALAREEISLEQAIENYQALSFAWRGDSSELQRLETLASLQEQAGRLRDSLLTQKNILSYFPDNPRIPEITDHMSDLFTEFFLGEEAQETDPIKSLALFREFRELTPAGLEGDRLIETLVDRILTIDLLDEASELLTAQVNFRSNGVKKARNGLKLALINMLNNNPQQALIALDMSIVPDIPDDLARERRHVRARALYDTQKETEAFALLEGDNSIDAEEIRADLYWRSQEWGQAARTLGRLTAKIQENQLETAKKELFTDQQALETQPPDTPLTDTVEPQTILRWAVALALSKNKAGLDFIRRNYDDVMQATPYYDNFTLIVNESVGSSETMQAIASQISQVGQYEAFLDGYRNRFKNAGTTVN